MNTPVYVVGVGITKFTKPTENADYPEMAQEAVKKCLKDSGLSYNNVDHALCGYVYGDSACGQRILYDIGMTGIPIMNINNNCASGSSAIYAAHKLIQSGASKCCLVLGFDVMQKGSLTTVFKDRSNPVEKHVEYMAEHFGLEASPILAQLFGNAGREHMKKYGTKEEHFAKVAWKNHQHSLKNPICQNRKGFSVKQIMEAPSIFSPLTLYQCCPTSNGAAAIILVNHDFLVQHQLLSTAVELMGIVSKTDDEKTFGSKSAMNLVGYSMTKSAASDLYRQCNMSPMDFDIVELHDCFSANELITYEALQLCQEGKAGNFIDQGDNTYGGKYVINPSGGLLAKGHPLGATGVAQCVEICLQLRGLAEGRQVKNAKFGLQHNLALGGVVNVAAYRQLGASTTNRQRAKL